MQRSHYFPNPQRLHSLPALHGLLLHAVYPVIPARFATLSPHPPVHVRWSPWSAFCARSLPYKRTGELGGAWPNSSPRQPSTPQACSEPAHISPLLSASRPLSLAVQSRLSKSKQPLSQYHQIKTAVKQLQVRDGKRQTGENIKCCDQLCRGCVVACAVSCAVQKRALSRAL